MIWSRIRSSLPPHLTKTMHDRCTPSARAVAFTASLLSLALLILPTPSAAGNSGWAGDFLGALFNSSPSDDIDGTLSPSSEERLVPVNGAESDIGVPADRREVTIFTTRSCGYCRQAKAFFKQRGIAFDELDIDISAFAKAEFERLKGRGVPLIVVRGQVINGFSKRRVARLLAAN